MNSLEALQNYIRSKNNSRNFVNSSNVPLKCKSEPCMLGVDEAGRGPVLGPMVYGVAYCPINQREVLQALGCDDSKALKEEKRDEILLKMFSEEKCLNNVGWAAEIISPNYISNSMYKRSKHSLNESSSSANLGPVLDNGISNEECVSIISKLGSRVAFVERNFSLDGAADHHLPVALSYTILDGYTAIKQSLEPCTQSSPELAKLGQADKFSYLVSMNSAIDLIKKVAESGANITEVYVDTVGPPEKYQARLSEIFPDYKITVAKKADSIYPIVSAASIVAKVTRDHALKVWQFQEGLEMDYKEFGSGYPGDPLTKKFIQDQIDNVFGYPLLVRFSWSTAEHMLQDKAATCTFEEVDDDGSTKKPSKSISSFFSANTENGTRKRKKHKFFEERYLTMCNAFE